MYTKGFVRRVCRKGWALALLALMAQASNALAHGKASSHDPDQKEWTYVVYCTSEEGKANISVEDGYVKFYCGSTLAFQEVLMNEDEEAEAEKVLRSFESTDRISDKQYSSAWTVVTKKNAKSVKKPKNDATPPPLPGIGADPDKCNNKCDEARGEICRQVVKDIMSGETEYKCITPEAPKPGSGSTSTTPTTPTTPNMHDKAAFLLGAQFEGGALVNISGNGIVTRGAGAILGQLGFSTGGSFDLVGNLGVGINTVTKGFVPATLRAGLEVGISPWKEKRVKLLALFNYEGTAAQGAAMTSTDPTCVDQFGRPKADPFMRCTTGDHAMKWLQQYAVGVGVKGDFLPGAGSARIQPKFLASVGWGDEGGVSIMLNAAAAFDWNKTSK